MIQSKLPAVILHNKQIEFIKREFGLTRRSIKVSFLIDTESIGNIFLKHVV